MNRHKFRVISRIDSETIGNPVSSAAHSKNYFAVGFQWLWKLLLVANKSVGFLQF